MSKSAERFDFPAIHQFPPFYTRQPTDATRTRQLEIWSDLLLAYAQHTRQTCLSRDLLIEIIEISVNKGDVAWIDTAKTEVFIYWRRPDAWGQLIYNWIAETGQRGSVLTLHEVSNSATVDGQDFYQLDERMLRKALNVLVKQNKAQIFSAGSGEDGVKFF
ncbi:vacuolar protein sorting 25 [Syncephalis fuscata]|nr:vacuolar protein sorting 25 [Syncephalis fuscata]